MTQLALQRTSHNDLIDNPSPRCACELVLDTSGSMSGEPMRALNSGVQDFIEALKDDDGQLLGGAQRDHRRRPGG